MLYRTVLFPRRSDYMQCYNLASENEVVSIDLPAGHEKQQQLIVL